MSRVYAMPAGNSCDIMGGQWICSCDARSDTFSSVEVWIAEKIYMRPKAQ